MRRDGHFGMRPTVPPSVSSQNVDLDAARPASRVPVGVGEAEVGAAGVQQIRAIMTAFCNK